MRLVATSIVASEVFFLKLKHFILTGIAGGLIALKLQLKSLFERATATATAGGPVRRSGAIGKAGSLPRAIPKNALYI